ncbi:ResB protein required for cytochrome C biosynthesis [bacterium (Candidatus Blackallbacteria) CG17_big_fil_post_rev_8_21_14_2_50_48_46]|uniref:ResB protein required for cytochrome C biosynthesis n=1 Tax=bacterium (Candidatus Blackallbacteria) CG17_big_fil_post_rev_8_21_14_2_50_48_46 TaxID=2014261 RepID=A0A2M7G7R3_9BACT|nr:MAG: ResB protein required for cytochrome C biosynthesis [bacterium (Candidatus Blackallbacteria) CG17_big_fil_post_rev_8_21_14_2_50_48_46]
METLSADLSSEIPDQKNRVKTKKPVSPPQQVLNYFGSLQLTVLLLVLSILLIFFGTLAQIDQGVWTVVKSYFRSWIVWIPFQLLFPRDRVVPGAMLFPGGWTLGSLLLINLLVAHIQRFTLKKDKIGLFIIHSGLILLLAGEGLTGLMAAESNMSIDEGSSSNYSEDIRHPELAIIDGSDAKTDWVTVVPESKLRSGRLIQDPQLPFDIQVDRFLKNSALDRDPKGGFTAKGMPEVSGTQSAQGGIDMPSALITLYKPGTTQVLGSYTTSTWLKSPHKLEVNGKNYDLALRFARSYKPYTLFLKDFRFDRYPGTEIPKNFESTVRILDPEQQVDREVRIWMNHPLRYRGETYYQASYKPDESGTVLQVVQNPSWLIPYISCILVTFGLLWQFGFSLLRSLKRRQKRSAV